MQLALFILLIPLLGIGLLLADVRRQTAFPFESRKFWKVVMNILGGLAVMLALTVTASSFIQYRSDWESTSQLLLVLLIATLLIYTGMQTFRLPATWPGVDENINNEDVIDRYSPPTLLSEPQAAKLRSGAWLLTFYPLFYLLPIALSFSVMLLVFFMITAGSLIQMEKAFQSQLLWLILVSVHNQQPLPDEFRALAKSKSVSRRKRLRAAAEDLEHGDGVSLALERNRLLPAAVTAAIRVNEGGPRFEETLRRLAFRSTQQLRNSQISLVSELMTQAFILLIIGSGIIATLMYWIVPKLKAIFNDFGVELPRTTNLLINFSDAVISRSTTIFFWVGMAMAMIIWTTITHLVGWSSLSVPILMHWFPKRDAPEMLRSLAGIADQNAALPEKISQLSHRPGRPDLGARYERIRNIVSAGTPLSEALWQERVVNALQREAIAGGERGGHLGFVLFTLADTLDLREQRRSSTWLELLRPAVVIVCGLLTAFVVIALFSPIIKLLQELS